MTTMDREALIAAAFEAKEGSYSPYSKFRVGCALLAAGGTIFKGANVENASYGGTICAERTAFVKAVSEGARSFLAMAVVTLAFLCLLDTNLSDVPSALRRDVASPLAPCGMCRQFIREFCALDMPVILVPANFWVHGDGKGAVKELTLGDLLPLSFGPDDLTLPRI